VRTGAGVSETHDVLAEAAVAAWASAAIPLTGIEELRPQPGPIYRKPVGPKTFRFADDLTVAGMAAMLHAIDDFGMHNWTFADWGMVAAPRFAGRMITAMNIVKSKTDPHFSISPHTIPNLCLHSASGAASVAFGIHGPNLGVGGGPGAVPEALVAAMSVLAENRIPGIWVVLAEFNPEPRPDGAGKCVNAVTAHAVAIALASGASAGSLKLRRSLDPVLPGSVRDLQDFIQKVNRPRGWKCGMTGLGSIELTLSPNSPSTSN
jgi:hypothetical protein